MTKGKKPLQNGVNPEAEQKDVPAADSAQREPALRAWHAILKAILEDDDEIQHAVQLLLRNSPSGHAFLEYLREYRPRIGDSPVLDFLDLVTTYEGIELLEKLKAEPRFGPDPDFFIWKEFWPGSKRVPSRAYANLMKFSHVMAKKAATEEERGRIRVVREAIERELQGRRASRTQKDAPRGKSGSLAEVADHIDEPETTLGKELKRILAHREKPGALPNTKPVPGFDWAHYISWHPAFRNIFP